MKRRLFPGLIELPELDRHAVLRVGDPAYYVMDDAGQLVPTYDVPLPENVRRSRETLRIVNVDREGGTITLGSVKR